MEGVYHVGMIDHQSLAPLPFLEDGWRSRKSQASEHCLIFLVTSPHLEAIQVLTKSHLIRTKNAPITQEIPQDLGALGQEPGPKPNIYFLSSRLPVLRLQSLYLPALRIHLPDCLLSVVTSCLTGNSSVQARKSHLAFLPSSEDGTVMDPFAPYKNLRFMIPHHILLQVLQILHFSPLSTPPVFYTCLHSLMQSTLPLARLPGRLLRSLSCFSGPSYTSMILPDALCSFTNITQSRYSLPKNPQMPLYCV